MVRLAYFKTGLTSDTDQPLEKKACLFYEADGSGIHKDSKGREHKVDEDYLRQLEENTNAAIAGGETIYLIDNHKKDVFDPSGYIDGSVFVKRVDEGDVQENPKLKNILGRLALFAERIKVTGANLKKRIQEGIKFPNISVGLDMDNMKVKEVSLTCMPALALASMFNEHRSEFMGTEGLTMEEGIQNKAGMEGNKEAAHEMLDIFLTVVENLKHSRDEDLPGGTREAFFQAAIEDFVQRLTQMTDIGPDPGYASQTAVQDNINREHTYAQDQGRPQIVGYTETMITANFTMGDVENSRFTMEGVTAEFIEIRFGKKKKGLLRRGLELAGTAATGAAALRYGGKFLRGAKAARSIKLKGGKRLGLGAQARSGLRQAGSTLQKDIGRSKKFIKRRLGKRGLSDEQMPKLKKRQPKPVEWKPAPDIYKDYDVTQPGGPKKK